MKKINDHELVKIITMLGEARLDWNGSGFDINESHGLSKKTISTIFSLIDRLSKNQIELLQAYYGWSKKLIFKTFGKEYISFSAKLNGEHVRITVPIESLDIVSRDNTIMYDTENSAQKLKNIEFEDIY